MAFMLNQLERKRKQCQNERTNDDYKTFSPINICIYAAILSCLYIRIHFIYNCLHSTDLCTHIYICIYIYIYLDGVYLAVCPCKMCMCVLLCVCGRGEKMRERQDKDLVKYITRTQVISSAIFIDELPMGGDEREKCSLSKRSSLVRRTIRRLRRRVDENEKCLCALITSSDVKEYDDDTVKIGLCSRVHSI